MHLRGSLALLAAPLLGKSIAIPIAPRSGTTTESITYITPIWEGALASHTRSDDLAVLSTMKTLLGLGGTYTKLGWSFSSWALSRDIHGEDSDYSFDPTNLNYMLDLAVSSDLPILVHMNNGRWADCCTPNSSGGWGDVLLDIIAAQPNTTVLDRSGKSLFSHNGGNNYFTLSRLNSVYRDYKKRNVQASTEAIVKWAAAHPSLFAGVSLDSETIMPNNGADYNPLATEEWGQWLQNIGIYGPGGAYFGQGRVPAFESIESFNGAVGTTFASWSALQPPPTITPGETFSEEWQRWRVTLINHAVADETLWIAEAGVPRALVYGHQTPRLDDYGFADALETSTAANGASGVTYYAWTPSDIGQVDNPLRGAGKNNFGVFELNPLTTDAIRSYNTLLTLVNDGIKIICPNSWESDQATKDQYALFGSPDWGDTFGLALNKFLADRAEIPRSIQPPPWNPGNRVVDFYNAFPAGTSSGPDNHLEPAGSVGGVIRKSVYSAVGGLISYSVALPTVSGTQRLNLWTSVGIRDGAGNGGESTFQVTINGQALFGTGLRLNKNYWVWKRWLPAMVDVTPWAGSTVTFAFTTTGENYYGWTTWGAPAIYASATDNDLAARKSVSVSSTDGAGEGTIWDSQFLTDGNVDGEVGGRIGWSSVSHPSATGSEYAAVDLGAVKSIGRVVLFARSDLVQGTGSGFPVDFRIQGSGDGKAWTDLLVQTGFPAPLAGEGLLFVFPDVSVRWVKVVASKLGGVGGEDGYRMQLGDFQVYA